MIKNFAWIATWKITHRCNLHCVYCDHSAIVAASQKEDPDYDAIVDRIAQYRPKALNLTGGEATLVKPLPRILERIKKEWNPHIYVVHNGTQPKLLIPMLPFLDRIVISIDGPGEINKANRGIDGNGVLGKIKEIIPDLKKHGTRVSLNCVVTKQNLPAMRELTQRVSAVSDEIILCFSPVIPPLGDLSVIAEPRLLEEFRSTYAELRAQGHNVIQTFDNLMRHADYSRIQCYNQFFNLRVNPEGKISSCAMNVPINPAEYAARWKRLLGPQGFTRAWDMVRKTVRNRVGNSIDFSCTALCYCESWLDVLFCNQTNESIPVYLRAFAGRLSEEEIGEMDRFVRAYINPAFDVGLFRARLREVIEDE